MSATHSRIMEAAKQCKYPNDADTLELIHVILNRYTGYEDIYELNIYEMFADKIEQIVEEYIGEDMTDKMIRLISIMKFALTNLMHLVEDETWWNAFQLKHKILHLLASDKFFIEKSNTGDPRSLMDLATSSIIRSCLDTKSLPACLQRYVWYNKSVCECRNCKVQLGRIGKLCMYSDCNDVIDMPSFLFEEK